MEPSEMEAVKEQIFQGIRINTKRLATHKQAILEIYTTLSDYGADFSEYLTAIDGFLPTGAWETLMKDIKDKQVTEFLALTAVVDPLVTFLNGITEF